MYLATFLCFNFHGLKCLIVQPYFSILDPDLHTAERLIWTCPFLFTASEYRRFWPVFQSITSWPKSAPSHPVIIPGETYIIWQWNLRRMPLERLSQNHQRALILFKRFSCSLYILCRKENGLMTKAGCLWALHLGNLYHDLSDPRVYLHLTEWQLSWG